MTRSSNSREASGCRPGQRSTCQGPPENPPPVHERRVAATMVLIQAKDRLDAGDADVGEGLLREAKTWALVDPLAGDLIGPLSEREDGVAPVLERWAQDDDCWIGH